MSERAARRRAYGAGEPLDVAGWASVSSGERMRDQAMGDARREAVGQVLRAVLPAAALAEHAEKIEETFISHSEDYVETIRLLGEKREGEFFKVRARVGVWFSKVLSDLLALGLITRPDEGLSRVAVSVPVEYIGEPQPILAASDWVAERLSRYGLRVIAKSSHSFYHSETFEINVDSAGAWGREMGVGAAVVGIAEISKGEEEKIGNMFSYLCRLRAAAVKSGTEKTMRAVSEATGLGATSAIAAGKALSKASDAIGDELGVRLSKALMSGRGIRLRVLGLEGIGHLRVLLENLRLEFGMDRVFLAGYAKGDANLIVQAPDLTGEGLAAAVLRSGPPYLEVREIGPREVELGRRR